MRPSVRAEKHIRAEKYVAGGNDNGTDGQTDRQTDGQTECDAICGPSYDGGPHKHKKGDITLQHIVIMSMYGSAV